MGKTRDYIVRFAKARGITEDEAYRLKIVKEVCDFYGGETLQEAKLKQAKEKIHARGNDKTEICS